MDTKKSTSIRFKDEDKRLIKWLRKRFGGSPQHAVVSMALKLLYEQERASQRKAEATKEGQAQIAPDAAP